MTEGVTLLDCQRCRLNPNQRKLLLVENHSPGDALVMTAAVESLKATYPGEFRLAVRTNCDAIFENNPHIEKAEGDGWETVEMHYPLIDQSNQRAAHFMQGFCDYLSLGDPKKKDDPWKGLGKPVPLTTNRPRLYLSKEEPRWASQIAELGIKSKFWLVNAGTKQDYTAKGWGHDNYQAVVNALQGRVLFVQIGEKGHLHKPLDGVVNLLGKTDARQLIRLAYHCAGGLGPSTFLQHLCAAWEKPYVCLLGGREPVSWTAYPYQATMHTMGALACCRRGACWKSRTVRLNDGDKQDSSLCEQPVFLPGGAVPRCLAMISPDEVARAIERYLVGGVAA